MVSRRALIASGIGAIAVAGAGYRIWDRGVFAGVGGPAYAPWASWQGSIVDGVARPLHAAILAANPHDTQPWLFEIVNDTIVVYADRIRNLGSFDPFRREMHLGLGAAIEIPVRRRATRCSMPSRSVTPIAVAISIARSRRKCCAASPLPSATPMSACCS